MKIFTSIVFLCLWFSNTSGQLAFADSCFTSANLGTGFGNSADLRSNSADLMLWNGNGWWGSWSHCNLVTPPPDSSRNCRAIFTGSGTAWTTGGEGFSMRLQQPLVAGQTYAVSFTYVSAGVGSTGSFAPLVYSNKTGSASTGNLISTLPSAGYSWTTNILTFTATAIQNGDNWITVASGASGTSGIIYTLCASCHQPVSCGVNLGPDRSLCAGQQVTLDGTQTGASYWWNSGSTLPTTIVYQPGMYWLQINQNGCVARDTIVFTANNISAIAQATNTTCAASNGSALITPVGGTYPYAYTWNTGDTLAAITNLAAATYTVTVADADGCIAIDSAEVKASALPDITITTDKAMMCSGDSALICAPAGYVAYDWNSGNTASCFYTFNAGAYYVTVTDSAGCKPGSNRVEVAVYRVTPVAISIKGDTLMSYNAVSYQWYLDNLPIPGATGSTWVAQQTGNYMVEITDSNGCRVTSNAQYLLVNGIDDVEEGSINIYPNPLQSGNWQVQVSAGLIQGQLYVYDANGRVVYHTPIESTFTEVDAALSRGVYFFHLQGPQGSYIRKLVKL